MVSDWNPALSRPSGSGPVHPASLGQLRWELRSGDEPDADAQATRQPADCLFR